MLGTSVYGSMLPRVEKRIEQGASGTGEKEDYDIRNDEPNVFLLEKQLVDCPKKVGIESDAQGHEHGEIAPGETRSSFAFSPIDERQAKNDDPDEDVDNDDMAWRGVAASFCSLFGITVSMDMRK